MKIIWREILQQPLGAKATFYTITTDKKSSSRFHSNLQ